MEVIGRQARRHAVAGAGLEAGLVPEAVGIGGDRGGDRPAARQAAERHGDVREPRPRASDRDPSAGGEGRGGGAQSHLVGAGGAGHGGGDLDEVRAGRGQGERGGAGEAGDGRTVVAPGHDGTVAVADQVEGQGQSVAAGGRDDDLLAGGAGEAVAVGEEIGPVDGAAVPDGEGPTLGLALTDRRVRLAGIAGHGGLQPGALSHRGSSLRGRTGEEPPRARVGRHRIDVSVERRHGDQDRAVRRPVEGVARAVLLTHRGDRRNPSRGRRDRRLSHDGSIRRDAQPGRARRPGSREHQRTQRRDRTIARTARQHRPAGVERLHRDRGRARAGVEHPDRRVERDARVLREQGQAERGGRLRRGSGQRDVGRGRAARRRAAGERLIRDHLHRRERLEHVGSEGVGGCEDRGGARRECGHRPQGQHRTVDGQGEPAQVRRGGARVQHGDRSRCGRAGRDRERERRRSAVRHRLQVEDGAGGVACHDGAPQRTGGLHAHGRGAGVEVGREEPEMLPTGDGRLERVAEQHTARVGDAHDSGDLRVGRIRQDDSHVPVRRRRWERHHERRRRGGRRGRVRGQGGERAHDDCERSRGERTPRLPARCPHRWPRQKPAQTGVAVRLAPSTKAQPHTWQVSRDVRREAVSIPV